MIINMIIQNEIVIQLVQAQEISQEAKDIIFIVGMVIVGLIALSIAMTIVSAIFNRFKFKRIKRKSISAFNNNDNVFYGAMIKAPTNRKIKKRILELSNSINPEKVRSISVDTCRSGYISVIIFQCNTKNQSTKSLNIDQFKAARKKGLKNKFKEKLNELTQEQIFISANYENSRGFGRNNKMNIFYVVNDKRK